MSAAILPQELPVDATGFTRRLVMHMNYGSDGGAATYTIHGPGGIDMPVTYQYDARKKAGAPTGFFIDGVDECFKRWTDLAVYWPTYIAERAA